MHSCRQIKCVVAVLSETTDLIMFSKALGDLFQPTYQTGVPLLNLTARQRQSFCKEVKFFIELYSMLVVWYNRWEQGQVTFSTFYELVCRNYLTTPISLLKTKAHHGPEALKRPYWEIYNSRVGVILWIALFNCSSSSIKGTRYILFHQR